VNTKSLRRAFGSYLAVTGIDLRRRQGKFGGDYYILTLKNEGLAIVYNPDYNLPREIQKADENVVRGIKDGTIAILP
jgi:hypothetical protein